MTVRRLLLFDIDGTLVWGGPAKDAFTRAMLETYGTAGETERVSFSGKTDPQIARELLETVGFDPGAIDAGFEDLWRRYTGYLEAELVSRPMVALPGVRALLDALVGHEDVGVGLLTGNMVRGAELKLGSVGLHGRFRVGSYGSDHERRDELPAIALERARAAWGADLDAADAVVIGDTPRDVSCGRRANMRTVAVATGYFDVDALTRTGADRVLADLSETESVLQILTG